MRDKSPLLTILADGQFHSGQELSSQFDVSRAAIWNDMQQLQQAGYEIHSVRGRGYRLYGGVELLEVNAIQANFTDDITPNIEIVQNIDSTNQFLLAEHQTRQSGDIIIAEQQYAGQGRLGRRWISPYAMNLYCSILWRFNFEPARLGALSLVVAMAIIQTLQQIGAQDCKIKWPNDILFQGEKLAGILIDSVVNAAQQDVIIGIGINLNMHPAQGKFIDQAWTSVNAITGETVMRNQAVAILLQTLFPMLEQYAEHGFSAFQSHWQQWDALFGHEITLQHEKQTTYGIAQGVNTEGHLLVKSGETINAVHSGEVQVRLV